MATILANISMMAEDFPVWAEARPEKHWELYDGTPQMQQSQSWGHSHFKFRIARALDDAIASSGLKLFLGVDGVMVQTGPKTAFQPDVVVFAGSMDYREIVTRDPVIAVEVLSPSTERKDFTVKLAGYFNVATIEHYLIANWEDREIIHHRREGQGLAKPSITRSGMITLDPPGLTLDVSRIFADS